VRQQTLKRLGAGTEAVVLQQATVLATMIKSNSGVRASICWIDEFSLFFSVFTQEQDAS
jgi:hypothetical protein